MTDILSLYKKYRKLLSEREDYIIRQRLGLDDEFKMGKTLKQVGEELGLTKQRVHRIQGKAIAKMMKINHKKVIDTVSKDMVI